MKYLLLLSLFATLSVILAKKPKVTEKVIFDIEIQGKKVGKIEIGIFGKIVPKTVKNFVELCKRPFGKGYKGSQFSLVEAGFLAQGGNFLEFGHPGWSIYGPYFKRENFELQHYGAGWLSMVNDDYRHNGIEFFITLTELEKFDLINVVFGKVIRGMDVVRIIENTKTNRYFKPMKEIVIADCTVEVINKSFAVAKTDATE